MYIIFVYDTKRLNALLKYQEREDTKALYAFFLSLIDQNAYAVFSKIDVAAHEIRDDCIYFQSYDDNYRINICNDLHPEKE